MKVNEWKEMSQVVTVLSGLTFASLHGLLLTEELKELVRGEKWRQSTPAEKNQLLNMQYYRDYLLADLEQRELIKITRVMIETQLNRHS